jgi:hypothetical protein
MWQAKSPEGLDLLIGVRGPRRQRQFAFGGDAFDGGIFIRIEPGWLS